MDVTVLEATDSPEELACRAARGDYTDTTFTINPSFNEQDTCDMYVRRDSNEGTSWIENTIAFEEVMDGIEGDTIEEKKETLLSHLIKKGHFGVFEHPQITFAVNGISRVTLAQITRHRHLSFDVQSMRYVDFGENGDAIIPPSLRNEEHVTRDDGVVEVENREFWEEKYSDEVENLFQLYESMVEDGVPKEDARYLLPIGTTVNLTVSGNARSFMHLWNIRGAGDAQAEIRQLTEMMKDELMQWMPLTYEIYSNTPTKLSP